MEFKLSFVEKATGIKRTRKPYYKVSVDGKTHCLVLNVGEDEDNLKVLAQGNYSTVSIEQLWKDARLKVNF